MKCPMCERDATPTEVDREAELATYECMDCLTSWHVDFGAVLRGDVVNPVVQDESTLNYLVTNESTGYQETVPGWRKALRAMQEMLNDHVEYNGVNVYSANRSDDMQVELSASPDPQYRDCMTYFPSFHAVVKVTYHKLDG